ncbi:Uncharacterised protein [Starkeya nomas]|uniref:diguanylate cyclase n=1 Tax=Starkeya nomas TaxID=2666134 RepID=A0A5S9P020_9HYPH|nr:diguanylate cyclase [Starkeya nomas]CAA0096432.1 Uncharacterised protein [Starkeya nomas]
MTGGCGALCPCFSSSEFWLPPPLPRWWRRVRRRFISTRICCPAPPSGSPPELANGIIVLPAVLTAPALSAKAIHLRRPKDWFAFLMRAAPAVMMMVSIAIGFLVGGPGVLAFPVPALLWCALTYPLFPTVMLTMLVSIWHLIAVSLGLFTHDVAGLDAPTMSGRLAIMLLALGPLIVASINAARQDLLKRLEILAIFDTLTGALTRTAFLQRGRALLAGARSPCVGLMLDNNHFKAINDTYGHAAGDKVLAPFYGGAADAARARSLRAGRRRRVRSGASETSIDDARHVAERLREEIEQMHIDYDYVPFDSDGQHRHRARAQTFRRSPRQAAVRCRSGALPSQSRRVEQGRQRCIDGIMPSLVLRGSPRWRNGCSRPTWRRRITLLRSAPVPAAEAFARAAAVWDRRASSHACRGPAAGARQGRISSG